jgi:uncharacterized protein (DUF3084 family)
MTIYVNKQAATISAFGDGCLQACAPSYARGFAQDRSHPNSIGSAALQRRVDRILAKAEAAENLRAALAAVLEARETLLGIARLTGEDKRVARSEPLTVEIVYVDRLRVLASKEDDPLLLPGGE